MAFNKKQEKELAEFIESHRDVLELLERVWRPESNELNNDSQDPDKRLSQETRAAFSTFEVLEKSSQASGQLQQDLPQQIGRFSIRKLLGKGGFGLVFLAEDPQLKREVALKIARPESVISKENRARFVREAETAASLNHSSIVPVFEAGNQGLIHYIAYAWCDGPTLTEWYQSHGPLAPTLVARLMLNLSDAVQHAHMRGVIHRDLKPDNILVESGSSGSTMEQGATDLPRLMITDFGLAKNLNETSEMTQSESIIGTPAFMPPERIAKKQNVAEEVGDVYSLGAILYFLLCGCPPLKGSTLLETIKMVQETTPAPPSSLNTQVGRDLDAICLKCLEKEPAKRYPSASELQSDLLRYTKGLPVIARQPSRFDRIVLWTRRKPMVAGLAAALMLVLVASTVALSILLVRSNSLKTLADQNALSATEQRDQARAALDAMTSTAAGQWLTSQRKLTSEQRKFLEETAGQYRELVSEIQARDDTDLESRLWLAKSLLKLAQIAARLGDTDMALDLAEDGSGEYQCLAEEFPSSVEYRWKLSEARQLQTNLLIRVRQLKEAESAVGRWQRVIDELVENDPDTKKFQAMQATAWNTNATILALKQESDKAIELRSQAITRRRLIALQNPDNHQLLADLALSLNNQSLALLRKGEMEEGEKLLDESFQLRKNLVDLDPDNVQYHENLAVACVQKASVTLQTKGLSATEEIVSLGQQALDVRRKLAREFPLDADIQKSYVGFHFDLAVFLNQLKRHKQSASICEDGLKSLSDIRILFSDETRLDLLEGIGQLTLGNALSGDGDYRAAVEAYSLAANQFEKLRNQDAFKSEVQPNLVWTYWDYATALSKLERYDEALENWDQAIEWAQANDKDKLRLARATTLVKLGKVEEAIAVSDELTGDGQQNPSVFYNAACVYALIAKQQERPANVESHARQAVALLQRSKDAGYKRLDFWMEDDELEILRERDDFKALFKADK